MWTPKVNGFGMLNVKREVFGVVCNCLVQSQIFHLSHIKEA